MLEPSSSLDSSLKIEEFLLKIKENGSSAMVVCGKFTHISYRKAWISVVCELVDKKDDKPVGGKLVTNGVDLPDFCQGHVVERHYQTMLTCSVYI